MADDVSAQVLDHLVQQKLVSFERATELHQLMEAGDTLHDLVVPTGEVEEKAFGEAYATASGMSFVELKDVTVPKEVLAIIPDSMAIAIEFLPTILNVASSLDMLLIILIISLGDFSSPL